MAAAAELTALRRRVAMLERLLDSLDDAVVCSSGLDSAVLFANAAAKRTNLADAASPYVLIKQAALDLPVEDPSGPESAGATATSAADIRVYGNLTNSPILHRVLDAQQSITWLRSVGEKGGLTFASRYWREMLGLPFESVAGRKWLDIIHPGDRERVLATSKVIASSRVPVPLDTRQRVADGSYRWMTSTVSPVRNDAGTIVMWAGVGKDIDDAVTAQTKLQEERARLRTITDQLPVGVGVLGRATCVFDMNRRAIEYFPDLRGAMGLQDFMKYYGTEDADGNVIDERNWPVVRSMTRGEVVDQERITVFGRLTTSYRRPFRISSAPLYDETNDCIGVVVVMEDISHEELMEQERARRQAATQLLSNASHELRTPLNGVVASADLLTHTRLTEEQAEHVACIQSCARLLLASVNDLLDYNRIASGKLRLEALPIRPAACAQRIAAVLQPAAAAKHQTLSIDMGTCSSVWALGDAQRIEQVMMNLLANSERFTPEGGTITVTGRLVADGSDSNGADSCGSSSGSTGSNSSDASTTSSSAASSTVSSGSDASSQRVIAAVTPASRTSTPSSRGEAQPGAGAAAAGMRDDAATGCTSSSRSPHDDADLVRFRFEVTDSGIGISAEAMQRLFEPFMQADVSTTRKHGGSGLGLSIVRQLVGLMGGELGVRSTVGKGSTFWFTLALPRAVAPLDDDHHSLMLSPITPGTVFHDAAVATPLCSNDDQHVQAPAFAPAAAAASPPTPLSQRGADGERSFEPSDADIMAPYATAASATGSVPARARSTTDGGHAATSASADQTPAPVVARSPLTSPVTAQRAIPLLRTPVPSPAATVAQQRSTATITPAQSVAAVACSTASTTPSLLRQPLVLIAEDNTVNVLVLRRMLKALGYEQLVVAANGKEAVEAAATRPVDIVLMDCHMDVMDGYQACRIIRAASSAGTPPLPILAVTAGALPEDRAACEAAGMDAVLTKPVSIDELRNALWRFLPAGCVPPKPQ